MQASWVFLTRRVQRRLGLDALHRGGVGQVHEDVAVVGRVVIVDLVREQQLQGPPRPGQ